MSREEVARLCGVSRQTIANIEKGSCVPSIPIILIISKALGVKFDTLVSYARRNPSFRVKAQEFRIPGQLIPGMYFKAGEKAVAYMELYKGTSYRLKRHIVQMVYVIEGEKLSPNAIAVNSSHTPANILFVKEKIAKYQPQATRHG